MKKEKDNNYKAKCVGKFLSYARRKMLSWLMIELMQCNVFKNENLKHVYVTSFNSSD